jgi:hypothetical protein
MTHADPCLRRVHDHAELDVGQILQLAIRFTGLTRKTPVERIAPAVAEELVDLASRARSALNALLPTADASGQALLNAACDALASGLHDTASPSFPREVLSNLSRDALGLKQPGLAAALTDWAARHEKLEARVRWLLEGTGPEELEALDPIADSDRIYHAVSSAFRIESRVLELLTINRIAQSSSASLFIRTTGESEHHAVRRFFDTFTLFAHYFEWGEDSLKGRTALGRINAMHGRYTLPNEGMKYILLDGAFTYIDGAARIAHRPLTDTEARGFFHAHIKLGQGMHIRELSHDWDEMRAWFDDFNRRNAAHATLKRETFELFVKNSLGDASLPGLGDALLLAARAGMDETFLQAVGYEAPTPEEVSAARSVFFTLGQLNAKLPRTAWVRSLQHNPARPKGAKVEELGVHARSAQMPSPHPDRPNGGLPEDQRPLLHAKEAPAVDLPLIPMDEVRRHNTPESLWVVIQGEVYDLTGWLQLHPGGLAVLQSVAGTDATHAYLASGHSEMADVFRLNYRIGRVG